MLTQPYTNKHKQTQTQTQTNTDSSPISSKRRSTSFQVARGLHSFFDTNKFGQTGNEPKYRHSDTHASQSRVHRIVAEREERDDKSGKREEKERRERERRKRKREGKRKREKRTLSSPLSPTHPSSLPSSPCVGSKRLRVQVQKRTRV